MRLHFITMILIGRHEIIKYVFSQKSQISKLEES